MRGQVREATEPCEWYFLALPHSQIPVCQGGWVHSSPANSWGLLLLGSPWDVKLQWAEDPGSECDKEDEEEENEGAR